MLLVDEVSGRHRGFGKGTSFLEDIKAIQFGSECERGLWLKPDPSLFLTETHSFLLAMGFESWICLLVQLKTESLWSSATTTLSLALEGVSHPFHASQLSIPTWSPPSQCPSSSSTLSPLPVPVLLSLCTLSPSPLSCLELVR